MTLVCEKCLKEHDEMALIKLSHPFTRGYKNGYIAGMQKMREIVDDSVKHPQIAMNSRMSLKRMLKLTQKAMEHWRILMDSGRHWLRWSPQAEDFELFAPLDCEDK